MGKGGFIINYEVLCQALHLPADTKIIDVLRPVYPPYSVAIVVEHPNIEPGAWIGESQKIDPTFETDYDGGKTEYAVKFISWN